MIQKVSETTAKTQKTNADELNEIESALRQNKIDKAKNAIIALSENLHDDFAVYGNIQKADELKNLKKETDEFFSKEQERTQKLTFLKSKAGDLSRLYIQLQKVTIDYHLGRLTSMDLPLGWTIDLKDIKDENGKITWLLIMKKLVGLLLTSILTTFGAPFWNDILSALVGIKSMTLKKR